MAVTFIDCAYLTMNFRIQSLSPLKQKIQDLNKGIIDHLNDSYNYAAA